MVHPTPEEQVLEKMKQIAEAEATRKAQETALLQLQEDHKKKIEEAKKKAEEAAAATESSSKAANAAADAEETKAEGTVVADKSQEQDEAKDRTPTTPSFPDTDGGV